METNKIYNMDCLIGMKSLPDGCVDLILTDPPYGIGFCSPRTENHDKLENDGFEEWQKQLPLWLSEMKRVLKPSGICCCCCCGGGKTPVTAMFTMEAIKHFNLIQTLVWVKFVGLGWKYRPAYENIVVLSKDKDSYNFYDKSSKCSNVIKGINQDIPTSEEHPTQKPVELMRRLIKIHSKKGDIVLDPFLGSGTTAVACIELERKFIGYELSDSYCKMAEKRIKPYLEQVKLTEFE